MKCAYCGCTQSRVVDSRQSEDASTIRRRRECEKCGRRFTTYERIEMVPLMVVKKDQTREAFDVIEAQDAGHISDALLDYIEKKNAEKPGSVSIQLYLEAMFLAEICR